MGKDALGHGSEKRYEAPAIEAYRAGGPQVRMGPEGGPTFFSEKPEGAAVYGKPDKYIIRPRRVFDTDRNIEHFRAYQQFGRETGHPAGWGKTNHPFWTAEPELKKWLDDKGHKVDAIKFAENTGIPSYAVYDPSVIYGPVQ